MRTRPLAAAPVALLAALFLACGGPAQDAHDAPAATAGGDPSASPAAVHANGHAGHAGGHAGHGDGGGLDAGEPSGFSVYHAGSVWTDQHGESRPLRSLEGRVQVVAMVYTSCGYACPRMLLDMKRIEGELDPALADRVGFVMVTIDPERDTPERLAEYARGARLDPDGWTLLTGDDGDILELAALLGVQYRRTAAGDFVHSNFLTVLAPDGRVAHRQMGLGADPAPTLATLRSLLE